MGACAVIDCAYRRPFVDCRIVYYLARVGVCRDWHFEAGVRHRGGHYGGAWLEHGGLCPGFERDHAFGHVEACNVPVDARHPDFARAGLAEDTWRAIRGARQPHPAFCDVAWGSVGGSVLSVSEEVARRIVNVARHGRDGRRTATSRNDGAAVEGEVAAERRVAGRTGQHRASARLAHASLASESERSRLFVVRRSDFDRRV